MSFEKACGHNNENEMEGEAEEVPAQVPEVVVLDESIEENPCGHNTDNENGVLEVMPLANPSDPLGLATVEPVKEMEVMSHRLATPSCRTRQSAWTKQMRQNALRQKTG
ncbi:hypothetical protein niasHS_005535 [Heterodera schachtii]|uniref:Uncharacterized protein n=1 Tax=Heterodera schachtii TaxID=97005 RepID=A0ABD2JMQ8_HETSC